MRVVAVAGSSPCTEEEAELAFAIGRILAERGVAVACGGLGGVMEAACRGAREAGGTTIGILPHERDEANPYVDIALPTGMGEVRNSLVAKAGEALIAIGTGFGTLSEIAMALKSNIRVIGLGSWDLSHARAETIPGLLRAVTPAEAVDLALG